MNDREETTEALIAQFRGGDETVLEELYELNRPLVLHILKLRAKSVPFSKSEIKSVGLLAMYSALHCFDATRGCKFASILSREIEAQVKRFMNDRRTVRVPNSCVREVAAAREIGCDGLSNRRKHTIRSAISAMSGYAAVEQIDESMCGECDAGNGVDREAVLAAMGNLSDRHRRIVTMRFGIDGEGDRTLAEIAAEFGFTIETARKQLASAIRNLSRIMSVAD